ncbi:hypothetical protein NAC44_02030 [Allorhizobium sp. BGMRC 0089]|uniref:hypothetical protein n=1 Tax=Allorhizobium sonneratiae TaxID=2934936 RepID=UPI0020349186|nr:hypothetical protein [Allorhizobium sonneratiae]MCM2291106.1 hypothetical protein [Allorhizobium sonneratiae]
MTDMLLPTSPSSSPRYTLTHEGRLYAAFTAEALATAGVPADAIETAQAIAHREAVKAECRRRIYAVGSAEAQMNVTSITATISAKTASSRSDAEKAILDAASQSIEWVTAMRQRFTELADDMSADYLGDASWPECPEAVIDLYAQF